MTKLSDEQKSTIDYFFKFQALNLWPQDRKINEIIQRINLLTKIINK